MFKSWWGRLSLTQRLLVGALLWVLCSLLAAGFLLNRLFEQHVEQQLQKELNLHMMQLLALTEIEEQQLRLTQSLSDPRFEQPLGGMYWQVQPASSVINPLYSRSLWDESLTPPEVNDEPAHWLNYVDPNLGDLYVLSRQVTLAESESDTPYLFLIAAQKELIAEPLQRFSWMLIVTLALLGCVLVIGVWWQLRLGLTPLRQLRRYLTAVHDGESVRVEGHYPQEIQPLVSEFNRVLQSHDQVVDRARTQAGNLAHAIKTPLAVLANAAKQNDPKLQQLVVEQVTSAQQQVDYHLSRARVAATVKTIGVRTAVLPAIQSIVAVLERAYVDKPVQVSIIEIPPNLYFKGEPQDLHEILGNVLDNAFKWCQSSIRVTASALPQTQGRIQLQLAVEDDGTGLTEEQWVEVFKRGVRADEIVPGSGLGLSIVADVVQLYGGEILAMRSPLGGLRIEIKLP